ncbi:MAG TPA: 3-hydroxyacyl-CoA dehydrogenase NAD-binding domain-containing protein [Thermoanaerobaculia bacterium]
MSEPTPAPDTAAEAETAASAPAGPPARLERRDDGLAWLVLDDPAKKVNTLSSRLFGWFDDTVEALAAAPPRGLVIVSGKPDGFVAGADIEELRDLAEPAEVVDMLRRGHELARRFAALPFPKVAAIHGAALGGGLELALLCDRRVATDHAKTKLGLPEVQLGVIPGWGGTQRLPRLVGVAPALELILTGRQVDARKAKRLGLVDDVCHPAVLVEAARRQVDEAAAGRRAARPRRGLGARAVELAARLPAADKLVYDRARAGVMAETRGHYPAPLAALDVVRRGMRLPLDRALAVEAAAFAELVLSPVAKSLMAIFFMKGAVDGRAAALARQGREIAGPVGVLGAGFMGAGIAQVLAARGRQVVMKDRDLAAVGRGLAFAAERVAERRKRRRLSEVEGKAELARIHGTDDYAALRRSDFVIEAVFEELAVKRRVLAEVEAAAPAGTIFASNTSTLPIAEIAAEARCPHLVVGMHFFSPVHKMPLLEVIRHPGSSDEAVATTVALGREMGKTVIVVGDGPGFFTSRVLGPFLNEAAWMLSEGARVEEIDRAVERWGFPVGPLKLLDEVGLDIAHHAAREMVARQGDRLAPPPVFARMLDDGRSGRKGGRGFYRYAEPGGRGKAKRVDESVYEVLDWRPAATPLPEREIAERCWLQMLNETARCIEDGVIREPVDVDVGVVFGFGFPPFRGGILREADRLGLPEVVSRLDAYADRYGERLRPARLLREMAEAGESFHQDAARGVAADST